MKTLKHSDLTQCDPVVENGAFVVVDKGDAVMEMIRRAVRVFKYEWFLDLELGPGYRQNIIAKNMDMAAVSADYKAAISGVPGFRYFMAFTMQVTSARRLKVNFRAMFDYGEIKFSEVI